MRKALAIMTVSMVSASLSGCGWLLGDDGVFRDKSHDYRQAKLEPVMQVPEGMSSTAIASEFDIPEAVAVSGDPLSGKFVTPRPPKLDVVADSVRINRLGKQQWILADASPAELWAQVRAFLNSGKIGVVKADAAAGQIETAWLQPVNAEQAEERYQFIVDQGVQRGTSEVRVVQAAKPKNPLDWPQYSDDEGREDAMLRELAQYLADAGAAGAVSMLAQRGIEDGGRVSFVTSENGSDPKLRLKLSFERSWAAVDAALIRGQFAVDDRNHEQKTFWVRALPELEEEVVEESKGWFSWLRFDSQDDDEATESSSKAPTTKIVKKEPRWWEWGGEKAENYPALQVILDMDTQNREATIRVADKEGKALDSEQASQLLNRIKRHLR